MTYPHTRPTQSSWSLQSPGFLAEGYSPANWGVWASALRGMTPFHTDSRRSCMAPAAETLGRCLPESGEKKTKANIKYQGQKKKHQKGLFFNCKILSSHQRITSNNNLANLRGLWTIMWECIIRVTLFSHRRCLLFNLIVSIHSKQAIKISHIHSKTHKRELVPVAV